MTKTIDRINISVIKQLPHDMGESVLNGTVENIEPKVYAWLLSICDVPPNERVSTYTNLTVTITKIHQTIE